MKIFFLIQNILTLNYEFNEHFELFKKSDNISLAIVQYEYSQSILLEYDSPLVEYNEKKLCGTNTVTFRSMRLFYSTKNRQKSHRTAR